MAPAKPIPDNYPRVNAYLCVDGAAEAIEFYLKVFGAKERMQVFASAIAAGARSVREVADQFYGDRLGMFEDPFGHVWSVASHVEDISPEEMERRGAEALAGSE
jgi:uncharacterized glyoxalase superfamily protein PhnB